MNKYFLFLFLVLKTGTLKCQLATKLFPDDTLKVFSGGSMSIWGDFYNTANSATGGSLVINLNGNVIMYGDSFLNVSATKIGGTGSLEMKRPRPAPYASSAKQVLNTGGAAISFPVFSVNSNSYVELKSNDLRVRDSLKFISGHILLNNNDLIVGNAAPGVITGYDETKFVVTNGNTTDTNKGYLIREQIGATNTVFPVGQAIGDYTPARILNNGTVDNFKVRVFDTVYENGYTLLTSINPSANNRSIQRTWDLREATAGGSNVDLTLQYNTATEASLFSSSRAKSYISHFVGTYPNNGGDTVSNWKWDMFKLSSTSTPVSPGTLTTGSSIGTASMKTRTGITSFSPFSITTWSQRAVPLPVKIIHFDAAWINLSDAKIEWQIGYPESVKRIELERGFNGTDFLNLNTYYQTGTTSSFQYTDAGIGNQPNLRIFYRLKFIENDGSIFFSDKEMLFKNNLPSTTELSIYPNPGSELVSIYSDDIDLSNALTIKLIDQSGKIVLEKTVEASGTKILNETISTKALDAGIYYIEISGSDKLVHQKLVIYH